MLLEGFRRVDEWRVIEREIATFDEVFVRNEIKIDELPRGTLTREELGGARRDRRPPHRARRGPPAADGIVRRFQDLLPPAPRAHDPPAAATDGGLNPVHSPASCRTRKFSRCWTRGVRVAGCGAGVRRRRRRSRPDPPDRRAVSRHALARQADVAGPGRPGRDRGAGHAGRFRLRRRRLDRRRVRQGRGPAARARRWASPGTRARGRSSKKRPPPRTPSA